MMYTVDMIRAEMMRLDEISGLDTSGIQIRISPRMTRCWGKCCFFSRNYKYQVKELVFAKRLMEYGTEEHILDVIRHEYAHAYVILVHNYDHGHDAIWRKAAIRFGCSGKRTDAFKEVAEAAPVKHKIRYQVICLGCGRADGYQRKSGIVKELESGSDTHGYYCTLCGSRRFTLHYC